MTATEASKGVRKFLRGAGATEIDAAWFQRSGAAGREALFHALTLPSTSKKNRLAVQSLLIAFFHSLEVEERLLSIVRSHPDPRVQKIDERVLRTMVAHRDDTRAMLLKL